ncbi:hypothetical protein B0H11DRAFT_2182390 [Mycena galericulata]|nr:hypothetical protein B0H11DRAFT_2182390 [Mycena galericulata]
MSTEFTLTLPLGSSLMDPLVAGDPGPFGAAIDPDVHWIIGSEKKDPERLTGNVASWLQEVNAPAFFAADCPTQDVRRFFRGRRKHGETTQRNGKPYNNNYAWFLTFSQETGKIVKIREYLDTALVHADELTLDRYMHYAQFVNVTGRAHVPLKHGELVFHNIDSSLLWTFSNERIPPTVDAAWIEPGIRTWVYDSFHSSRLKPPTGVSGCVSKFPFRTTSPRGLHY